MQPSALFHFPIMRSRPYIFTKFPLLHGPVIVGGTFLAYILMMIGQKTLRPTVISMYNYVQPIVGTSVSILLGMGTFGIAKGIAVALVFTGVYIVTQSKSREQMLAEQAAKKE